VRRKNLARDSRRSGASGRARCSTPRTSIRSAARSPTSGAPRKSSARWLRGRREQFIVATKCSGKMGPAAWQQGTSRKNVLSAIDASLKRLGTDYVDLYQVHHFDANVPVDETVEAFDAVVKSGKARYVGVSNYHAYRVARALGRAEASG
jgi:aryl-alcohol dehydrogenase (NADP+)